jgi:hypothetical protein
VDKFKFFEQHNDIYLTLVAYIMTVKLLSSFNIPWL